MELKTCEKGIYVRLCNQLESSKPSRLGKMLNIAISNKDEAPQYHLVYFKKNNTEFSKFSDDIKLLAGNYYVSGEIFSIVDNFNGYSHYTDREVIIKDKIFEVIDSEEPFNGVFYSGKKELLKIRFTNIAANDSFSGVYRFIPNNKSY